MENKYDINIKKELTESHDATSLNANTFDANTVDRSPLKRSELCNSSVFENVLNIRGLEESYFGTYKEAQYGAYLKQRTVNTINLSLMDKTLGLSEKSIQKMNDSTTYPLGIILESSPKARISINKKQPTYIEQSVLSQTVFESNARNSVTSQSVIGSNGRNIQHVNFCKIFIIKKRLTLLVNLLHK